MSQQKAVQSVPINKELTTFEAADLLNVSHLYLIELLELRQIPYQTVEIGYQLFYKDVIAYKKQIDAQRQQNLAELAAQAQELKMGYE